jgi:hypothetical protein
LIDEAGDFHFIRSDQTQYVGTAVVSGTSLSANYNGFTEVGSVFSDGSTHGTGTVSGTVDARTSLTATTQFKTDGGTASNGSLSLTFDALYNRPSALSTIAGNFQASGSSVVNITSSGALFSQDSNTQCVVNGTITIINATYNVYNVQLTYASCTGQAASLNGLQFTGMATLDNTQSPEQLILGVTATSGSTTAGVVIEAPRA